MNFFLAAKCLVFVLISILAGAVSARGDVILDWNALMLSSFKNEGSDATPPENSRIMGMVGGAVFDAVNSVNRSYSPYLGYFEPLTQGAGIDLSAAAAAAAHAVLTSVYSDLYGPTNGFSSSFDSLLATQLGAISEGPAKQRGMEVGMAAAQAMINHRANDGWNATSTYQPQPLGTPGRWQPGSQTGGWGAAAGSFVMPQWGDVNTFSLSSGSQFRPTGPNGFSPANYTSWVSSSAYTADFNLVKDIGGANSSLRTTDQTNIAYFWVDGPGTASPPGHWNRIAATVSAERGLSIEENARLFGLLGLAQADTGIATWEAKVYFDTWRPMYAINTANLDGNASTIQDASWSPLIPTPSFGAYTSGHSAFSMAGATVLGDFFGTDSITFTTTSESVLLPTSYSRTYSSFSEAAEEAGMSRIYGGIHFMSDNVDGAALGANVANQVLSTQMLPVPEPGSLLMIGLAAVGGMFKRRRRATCDD
jgi:membrane-associated phospholipid phosphatase